MPYFYIVDKGCAVDNPCKEQANCYLKSSGAPVCYCDLGQKVDPANTYNCIGKLSVYLCFVKLNAHINLMVGVKVMVLAMSSFAFKTNYNFRC